MLFSIKISDFGVKHNILSVFVEQYQNSKSTGPISTWALNFDYIPNCMSNVKLKSQVNRCLKSLCVTGHFEMITRDNGDIYISLTRKGLDAYNSEEFGTLEMEERRKKINNRYTIAFGVITAIGVFFAIFKDTLLSEASKKQEIKIIIQQQAKTPVHLTDTVVVYVDSSKTSK
jgi:hypothetical protein